VFLLKVVWLLPHAYDSLTIFSEVEAVVECFQAVSGQQHAHFLTQILKHVKEHHHQLQLRIPTLMPTLKDLSRATTPGAEGSIPINPFEAGNGFNVANGGNTLIGLDMFNEPENDFWSWLSTEGQSFSPLVNTLDTFDSSLARGGI
jgi:hypothetical protein